jgi:hypothetical protein
MVPRLRAAGGGECVGPAEDREPAEEDRAEMVARWTEELSPGGGHEAEDPGTAGRWGGRADNGTFRRSKGCDSDASSRTRFEYVGWSGFERNSAPIDYIRGANGKLSTSW